MNFYAYVKNNPILSGDPLGLGSPDFHNQTTYQEAREAGLSRQDAALLANATSDVDFSVGSLISLSTAGFWNPKHCMPHSGCDAYIKEQFDKALNSPDKETALKELAKAIHALQDKSFHADRDIGMLDHLIARLPGGGTNPDDPLFNSGAAAAARGRTADIIRDFMKGRGYKKPAAPPNGDIVEF